MKYQLKWQKYIYVQTLKGLITFYIEDKEVYISVNSKNIVTITSLIAPKVFDPISGLVLGSNTVVSQFQRYFVLNF